MLSRRGVHRPFGAASVGGSFEWTFEQPLGSSRWAAGRQQPVGSSHWAAAIGQQPLGSSRWAAAGGQQPGEDFGSGWHQRRGVQQ